MPDPNKTALADLHTGLTAESVPEWSRPLTEAEQKAANSAWPDFHGGKRHPFSTSTGMEGGCHHCGYGGLGTPLHEKPWEPPLVANSAPLSVVPPMTDIGFEARMGRIRSLYNLPALSNSTGGEPKKETNMKINITLSIANIGRAVAVLNALNMLDGVVVTELAEVKPQLSDLPVGRRVANDTVKMRELLREAARLKLAVKIDYTTEGGVFHSHREVFPFNFEDDLLLARDPSRMNETRSFKLSNMSRVEL